MIDGYAMGGNEAMMCLVGAGGVFYLAVLFFSFVIFPFEPYSSIVLVPRVCSALVMYIYHVCPCIHCVTVCVVKQ